ncbi:MAG: flagellar biosynthesis protein FlgE [Ignavibacteriae bacterium]|nr:MAG: flagellar biosynthesis protein FlgE [Ignavibacteriota bacterium]
MSLINSLFAGVSGIRNHQSMLDVIGNNIANVNSIGFKGSRVTFSDTFNQFVRYGTNPTETSGGTNTFQVGLGMKLNSVDRNWNQGTFERTGITTDLALQGDGLFVLNKNGETLFSRAGAFVFDADGQLVNPQNGAIVQGKVATSEGTIPPGNNLENIKIDLNQRIPAIATTKIGWGGNLKSTSPKTRSEKVVQSGKINGNMTVGEKVETATIIYNEKGEAFTLKTTYKKTANNTYDMTYEILDKEGNPLTPTPFTPVTKEVVFDAASEDGGALLTYNGVAPAPENISNTELGINLVLDLSTVKQGFTSTVNAVADDNRKPTLINGNTSIIDSLGTKHNLQLSFTKTDENSWRWEATIPGETGSFASGESAGGTITFDSSGAIESISPNPPVLVFRPLGGGKEQNIELDFGKDFKGILQTSGNSVISMLSNDGSVAASLQNVSIDQNGFIEGVFTNGTSMKLAQLLVATFPNRNALTSIGENMFTISANSGEMFVNEPGDSTNTTIQSGALEQSNVDLSEEFTRMIVSQRGFQANSRVITVSDTLLQEITNLVR